MGTGWAFDLPFLDVDGSTVFVELPDGMTYKADFNESNELEKYELKDLFLKGILALAIAMKQPLIAYTSKMATNSSFPLTGF